MQSLADWDRQKWKSLDFYLKRFGIGQTSHGIPDRMTDGYGLSPGRVETARKLGVSLIVTVDNGISAHEAARTAKDVGVDLIVTDHHRFMLRTLWEHLRHLEELVATLDARIEEMMRRDAAAAVRAKEEAERELQVPECARVARDLKLAGFQEGDCLVVP